MTLLWLLWACTTARVTPEPSEEASEAVFDTDAYLSDCADALCALEAAGCDTDLGCGDDAPCQAALAEDACFSWRTVEATDCLEAMAQATATKTCMSIEDWLTACGDVFTYTGDCR